MTDPMIQVPDEERAEVPTTQVVTPKPEVGVPAAKDDPKPEVMPVPEGLEK